MLQTPIPQFIEMQCVPRLSASAVYKDVRFSKRSPRFLQGMCPFASGETPPGSFIVDARTLRWTCLNHCRRAGQSVLAYFNGGEFPRPATGQLAACLERLAQLAEVPLSNVPSITPEAERELAAQERVISLLEAFLVLARRRFENAKPPLRRSLLAWLGKHGFDAAAAEDSALGVVGDLAETRRELEELGYSPQEIDASSLTDDPRLVGRVVGPIRDHLGRLLSFWAHDVRGRPPKFLFKGPWRNWTPLVGLEAAFGVDPRSSGVKQLVVFERLFDVLLLQSLGWTLCAAVVGPASDMTAARWQRLAELGVRRVTLVPDDSEPSRSGAWTAVDNALQASASPDVWVLPPDALRPYPSGVALARGCGVAKLQSLVKAESVQGFRYQAMCILRKHRPASGWTEPCRHAAWKEAIEFYASCKPEHARLLDAHFVPTIEAGLQRSWETFEPLPGAAEVEDRPLHFASPAEAANQNTPAASVTQAGTPPFCFVHGSHDVASLRRPISTPAMPPGSAQQTLGNPEPHVPALVGANAAKRGTFCPVHQCDTLECFCFD